MGAQLPVVLGIRTISRAEAGQSSLYLKLIGQLDAGEAERPRESSNSDC